MRYQYLFPTETKLPATNFLRPINASNNLCVPVKELEIYLSLYFYKCLKHLLGAENWWQAALPQSEKDIGSART